MTEKTEMQNSSERSSFPSVNSFAGNYEKPPREYISRSLSSFTEENLKADDSINDLQLKVTKIKDIKKKLFAVSQRLQESSKEKAELMKRIGSMEIQLIHLKEVKVEEDFKRFTEYHKDMSERSRTNLLNLINDTRDIILNQENGSKTPSTKSCLTPDREPFRQQYFRECQHGSRFSDFFRADPPPRVAAPYVRDEQKWLRRHLMRVPSFSIPSFSESTKIVYSKKPNLSVNKVVSQHEGIVDDIQSSNQSFEQRAMPSAKDYSRAVRKMDSHYHTEFPANDDDDEVGYNRGDYDCN